MEKNKKILTGIASVALLLVFIGYYVSLFMGNTSNASTYTTLIVMLACCTSVLWDKQKMENKALGVLVKVNCALFVITAITMVVQLFI